MQVKKSSTILLIGSDRTLVYLFRRYAERSGYRLKVNEQNMSSQEIAAINPTIIIFLSTELLARYQTFVMELTNFDAPIVVCSASLEEARARELGADYCLLHPLTYDDFQAALASVAASKRV